ncbi:unnamed protein product [Prunus armeniaca]
MVSPWPFAQWGIDLIRPMPQGKGQVKYIVVAVDYFTKWAEAEALAAITTARIEMFFWQNIVCRFGIPHTIVADNGRQFDSAKFKPSLTKPRVDGQNYSQRFSGPTTPPTSTGETPFSLSSGTEAVTPVEIGQPTY